MSTTFIESSYSHYLIIGCSVLGLVWGGVNAALVSHKTKLLVLLSSPVSQTVPQLCLLTPTLLPSGQQSRARCR